MTRGKIVLVSDDKILSSLEFNGDMYIDGHGEDVITYLKGVHTEEAYRTYVKRFNKRHFGYHGYPLISELVSSGEEIDDSPYLELSKENYNQYWHLPHYLYIKSIRSKPFVVKSINFDVTVDPEGVVAFYYGVFEDDCMEYSVGYSATKKD
ncbi:MAG: hypothetical protein LUD29_06395 [Clostridia bacterium]|nr:hypothetical protein [Clostridia bacterium]